MLVDRSTFIRAVIAALVMSTTATAAERPWFERCLVGMEIGPTGAQFGHSDPKDPQYCELFDGREIVRMAAEANSEYVVLWARDGDYAYYDSNILPKAPGLRNRDPLRDAVAEARRHKLPAIAYCVVQQGGHYLKAHPEWEMRGADGKPLGRFCYNSGYLEAMKAILAEQLAYGIDGFHIDMLDQGFGPPYGCCCDTCRKLFQKEFRRPLPAGTTWDEAWNDMLEFRYRSSERFEKALYAYIKSAKPSATVDFNYHGNPPFSFEVGQRPVQHAVNADFVTGETGVWGFSALGVGLNAQFYRAATPGRPFQVAMQRSVRMYHDQTTRPPNDIRWELFTLLSHGAFVTMVDKTAFDGRLDPIAYQRTLAAFKEARQKREHFGHTPVYEAGLYFSSHTRDWIGREEPGRYFQSFQGAHRACVMEHIQFGVLLDENLSLEGLKRFPVVVLPNAGILSAGEVALFSQYVREGGNLLVTGHTGQYDQMGQPQTDSMLADLIGAKVLERLKSMDNWVKLSRSSSSHSARLSGGVDHARRPELGRDLELPTPFLVEGPATVYSPMSAQPIGELYKPHRTTRQKEGAEGTDWPMSPDKRVGPAALLNKVGRGGVLTLACSPDFATASEHPIVEARKLLAGAVRLLHPSPAVRFSAPANVEAVVTDDPDARTLRIHLIAYNPTGTATPPRNRPYALPGLIEDAPIYRVSIALDRTQRDVKTLSRATKVDVEKRQSLELTINDIHEVVVIRY